MIGVCLHEIASCQEFVCGIHATEGFTRDTHKVGKSRTRADEYSFVSHFKQLVNGKRFADDDVCLNLNPQHFKRFHFFCNDLFWQAEFGDSVNQHAAGSVKCLKHRYLVAPLGEIACAGKP